MQEHPTAAAVSAYTTSGATSLIGFIQSDAFLSICGLSLAIMTFAVNAYFAYKRDKREHLAWLRQHDPRLYDPKAM